MIRGSSTLRGSIRGSSRYPGPPRSGTLTPPRPPGMRVPGHPGVGPRIQGQLAHGGPRAQSPRISGTTNHGLSI